MTIDEHLGANNERKGQPVQDPPLVSRRTLLHGALAGAVALPALRALTGRNSGLLRSFDSALTSSRSPLVPQRSGTLQVANLSEPNFIDPAYALEVEEFAVVRSGTRAKVFSSPPWPLRGRLTPMPLYGLLSCAQA
jgi:hypothetical protein